ncbi:Hydroxypyruvate isomerase [Crateriforma conspicua]|uniref:Hydroxypyruvate isomerase n=2 Tax=Planctomycetaceae TaxID=126 RepID=A0A5C6G2R8_9PLAN|nr:Hydroxypyruvate isomerase [Crateriforma conspicua]
MDMTLEDRRRWLASFSCNIEMWFKDLDFLDRITAAKEVGFDAIEIWNPQKKKLGGGLVSAKKIAERARGEGMKVTSISPGAPSLADANNLNAFIDWIDLAVELADLFDVPNFNLTGHKIVEGQSVQEMLGTYTRAVEAALGKLEAAGKIATIEPYNPFDHPGHFIYGVEPALSICRAVGSPNLKINWDFFHMQRTDGNLITHLEDGIHQVGYVQLADSPDRFQPGTGEVAYGRVLNRLRNLGYKGYIGAECFPQDQNAMVAASDIAALAESVNLQPPMK